MIFEIDTNSQFNLLLQENQRCVIKFGAQWCGPCQRFAPQFEELSEEHQDIAFIVVDVDECPEIANKYNITRLPSLVFVKNGKVQEKHQGINMANIETSIDYLRL